MRKSAVTLGLVVLCAGAAAFTPAVQRVTAPSAVPSPPAPEARRAERPTARVHATLDGPLSSAGGGRFLVVEIETPAWTSARDLSVDLVLHPSVRWVRAACAGDLPCTTTDDGHLTLRSARMDLLHADRRTFAVWLQVGSNPIGTLDVADITVRYTDQRERPMVWRQVLSAEVAPPVYAAAQRRPDVSRSAVMALTVDELYLSGWSLEDGSPEWSKAEQRTEAARHAEAARVWADALEEELPHDPSIIALQDITWSWLTDLPGLVLFTPATKARTNRLNTAIGAD